MRASRSARRARTLAADIAVRAVVVVQEDLLERRLAAGQRDDRVPGERGDERADAAVDLATQRAGAGGSHVHAGELGQLRRRPFEGDLDRLRAEVAQLGERALLDQAALPQDADAIAQRLDLAEDVRGEEDGLAALLGLVHG